MADEKQYPPAILNFLGSNVALGPFHRDLVAHYARWMNLPQIAQPYFAPDPFRPSRLEAWEAWYSRMQQDDTRIVFAIYDRQTWQPIGSSGLHRIDLYNATADFSIVLGERQYWGRGFATEAASLSLHYGFYHLSLHTILLRVTSDNERAIRMYQRVGFREVGRRVSAVRLMKTRADEVFMACAAEDYHASSPPPVSDATSGCARPLVPTESETENSLATQSNQTTS